MINLNHKIIGEGFPVIILHGLFGMLDNWQTIGKKLAEEGYMAILIDQRDHGKSPHTTAFHYDLLAEDLLHFTEENWIYKAHILGHSMGGKSAMKFAFLHEDKVEKLIVVDVMNKQYIGGHEDVIAAIDSLNAEETENREGIYAHLHSYGLEEGIIQFLLKNLSRKKEGGYEWKMNFPLLRSSYHNILLPIADSNDICYSDTLFVRGANSNYIMDIDFADIKKQFPNSTISTIKDAGHWVHADKPQEFFDAVKKFLKTDN